MDLEELPQIFKAFPDLAGFRPMLPDMVQATHLWSLNLLSNASQLLVPCSGLFQISHGCSCKIWLLIAGTGQIVTSIASTGILAIIYIA